jgi:hypothetical protein
VLSQFPLPRRVRSALCVKVRWTFIALRTPGHAPERGQGWVPATSELLNAPYTDNLPKSSPRRNTPSPFGYSPARAAQGRKNPFLPCPGAAGMGEYAEGGRGCVSVFGVQI